MGLKDGALSGRERQDSLMETFKADKFGYLQAEKEERLGVLIVKGDISKIPVHVQRYIAKNVALCNPKAIYICDGSEEEAEAITDKLVKRGMLTKLKKYKNSYLCRTDPADVARVEGRTFIVTKDKYESIPHGENGTNCSLGKWMSPEDMEAAMADRFPGSMKGRVMYVIPFSMGPIDSPLAKMGVQLTDYNYVVLCMRIMTRVSSRIWEKLENNTEFVECIHSIGAPRPVKRPIVNHWPCNPERVLVAHFPAERRVMSYGSGYGGNSLLGKKCFALRIASCIARDEGWLAEHMLVMGVTNPAGEEKFIAAAFPSGCGKTNMAMMLPRLQGWKVRCVGDDIAWMRFDSEGRLRAINPENGFFGIAPGTNKKTNPVAMEMLKEDTIFTNVAMTEDGGVFWEGMEDEIEKDKQIETWLGEKWKIGDPGKAAHPNSRFCCRVKQCPIIHPGFEDPQGFPIDAIIWGGRRPVGVPLVVEARSWEHGVMMGAAMKSEATAAAEHKARTIMHDPMAMRPFFGYNFGQYLRHWIGLKQSGRHMPAIFHVNWFRRDEKTNGFLWPGFGENIRVLDWVFKRLHGEDVAVETPIGRIPKKGTMNLDGLGEIDWDQLFSLPKEYLQEDIQETIQFLQDQVGQDLPKVLVEELEKQKNLIEKL